MYLFIETWKPTPAWMQLNKTDRTNYVTAVGGAIKQLIDSGVEIIAWGINDSDTDRHNGFDYYAVWKFPSKEMIKQFEAMVTDARWYTYFEQVNCSGLSTSPGDVLQHSINL
ncbi:MAG TPA: DUF6616 family protein [Chitinophagaceae bacterium]|nr:DUF6616 family protein [Chitinophagaceae bacterium]